MKNIKNKIEFVCVKSMLKLKNLIKDEKGQAGEWSVLVIVGIVIALIAAGIFIAFFNEQIEIWLNTLKGKIDGFFAFL